MLYPKTNMLGQRKVIEGQGLIGEGLLATEDVGFVQSGGMEWKRRGSGGIAICKNGQVFGV